MKLVAATLSALVLAVSASADDTSSVSLTSQYDFLLGDWDIESEGLQADGSTLQGVGVMTVYTIHDGQTLQADMRVSVEGGDGFVGSTMRTYDHANANWAVSWVPAGAQANGGGVAEWDGERMVETWPASEDQHGEFHQVLILQDITEDRFVVTMDRHYHHGGPTIEGIWGYVATRRDGGASESE